MLRVALALMLALPLTARAENPSYDLRSTSTDLMDFDVDYFAPPILLHRIANTFDLHRVNFEVAGYQQICNFWQQVCVAWDPQGRCTRWEQRCAQWELRAY